MENKVEILINGKPVEVKCPKYGEVVLKFNNGKPNLLETKETYKLGN
ncbi:hypothetical protein [Eremococcus coleocola]|uniref:Uncharacterized protein n=1 Tax=Eremococcus coleocola ACS-139-V-Col8 TaxID=908337 RepID=E4KPZ9_9LACT|nr:hypothetical protein [Eremococcus coleocola]EFR30949.1 hypothetical protein HMPREF9257_1638 [Eremococcus coleocola ACS-139-V-Col8]